MNSGDVNASSYGWSAWEMSAAVKASYGTVAVFGIIGNAIASAVLIRNPSLRTRTSYFILHLVFADLMVCAWTLPIHLVSWGEVNFPSRGVGEFVCRTLISKYPMWTCITVSVSTLVIVTLERYVAVVRPTKYAVMFNKANSGRMMVACWLFSFVFTSYYMLIYGLSGDGECINFGWPSLVLQQLVGIAVVIAIFILPLGTMFAAHLIMIKTLRQRANSIVTTASRNHNGQQARPKPTPRPWQLEKAREFRRVLLVVSAAYAVCWTPNQVVFFAYSIGLANVDFTSWYYHLSVVLALSNSCINPVIYILGSKSFREGLKRDLVRSRLHLRLAAASVQPMTVVDAASEKQRVQ